MKTLKLLILLLLAAFVFLDFEEINDLYLKYGIFILFVFFFVGRSNRVSNLLLV